MGRRRDVTLEGDDPGSVPERALGRFPPACIVRQGTSLFAPPAIPDLIGIRDRKYLDKTGLGRHRGVADIMRYAAMNQVLDVLGNYGGFIPSAEDSRTLPPPGKGVLRRLGKPILRRATLRARRNSSTR